MKFPFWFIWGERKDINAALAAVVLPAPTSSQKSPDTWRVVPPPAPVPVNPAVRAMETSLSMLVSRLAETLANSALYFPAAPGTPSDTQTLCEATARKARELSHHDAVKHGERYVAKTAELIAALRTAERAATLLRLLCADGAHAELIPLLRRVADSYERVIRHSAKVLESPAADVFTWSNSVVVEQNEAQTAVHHAINLLDKKQSMVPAVAMKMARAALWTMEAAAEATARAALECRGVVLPTSIVARESAPEPNRYVPASPHHFAHV